MLQHAITYFNKTVNVSMLQMHAIIQASGVHIGLNKKSFYLIQHQFMTV